MSFRYFAYGSILSPAHVSEWGRSHGVDPAPFASGRRAVLSGYRLVFDVPSRFWAGRVANIVADPHGRIEGVLFDLSERERDAVWRKEGVASGLYRPVTVRVETDDAQTLEAAAFEALPERRSEPGTASFRYVDALIEGAVAHGLSESWLASLRQVARDSGAPPPPGVGLGVRRL